jgi:hypothetical protein
MRKLILFLGLLIIHSPLHAAGESLDVQALKSFVKLYKSAKSPEELVRKLPGGGPSIEWLLRKAGSEKEMTGPLPEISYDFEKKTMQIHGAYPIEWVDAANGKFKIGGRDFGYDRELPFEENLQRASQLVNPKPRKTSWYSWILPRAAAQERAFFPDDRAQRKDLQESHEDGVAKTIGYYMGPDLGVALTGIAMGAGTVATMAGVIAAIPLHYGAEYAHAYGLGPDCHKQVTELKEVMNAGKISLAGLNCTNYMSNAKSISFWTPDGKKLPFIADWNASRLWVDQKTETYDFNRTELKSVTKFDAKGKKTYIKPKNPKFAAYKKNLEPYRQVLNVMGKYNSCYRCEPEIRDLVASQPVRYTEDSVEAIPASSTK